MKKLLFIFTLLLVSCEQRISTEELAKEIEQDIIEHFASMDDVAKVELLEFTLIHKGGNEYKGIADVSIENPVADLLNDWTEQDILNKNIDMTYSVEVISDGETYSWEFLD